MDKKLESPLIGAFITAWIIWNWQPILYFIFLDQDTSARINKAISYKSWLDQLVVPLGIAIFYVLILPYIQNILSLLLNRAESFQHNYVLEKKKQLDDEVYSQNLDAIDKKIKLEIQEKKLREESAINAKITDLEEQIKLKDNEIAALMEGRSNDRMNFESKIKEHNADYKNRLDKIIFQLGIEKDKEKNLNMQIDNLNSEIKSKDEIIVNLYNKINERKEIIDNLANKRVASNVTSRLKNN